MSVEDRNLLREIMLADLTTFAQRSLIEILPGVPIKWNWHLDLICSYLMDLAEGRKPRVLICVPPRSLKSVLCSIVYPAWLMARNPSETVLCISYAQSLSEDFARQCRRLMESDFYKSTFTTRLARDRRAAEQFETTAGGGRIANSVGGTITGRGGRFVILDDPMKPEEAHSEVQRTNTLAWVQSTLVTRDNDKIDPRQLIIMQRLHEEDIAGQCLVDGDWDTLILPAIATHDEEWHFTNAGRGVTHRRAAGELLQPDRENHAVFDRLRRKMGSMHFEAQYQQNPVPAEGNLVKRGWFSRYGPADLIGLERVIQSWDTGSKTAASHDYSVCTTWGLKQGKITLIHVWRDKLEMPELARKVIELSNQYQPHTILIEDKGSGMGLLQALRAQHFYKAIPIVPKGDKLTRLLAVTPTMEGGHVSLPASEPWVDAWLHEMCSFPTGRHDDQVDSTSQALSWINEQGSPGGLFALMREQYAAMQAAENNPTVHLRVPDHISHASTADGNTVRMEADHTIWVTEIDARSFLAAGFERLN